ncbi:iron ABC transporter permease [Alcaligenaceae bacterium]|nr:iron ABC transporter permease [Alcaligenaceae bacterium]
MSQSYRRWVLTISFLILIGVSMLGVVHGAVDISWAELWSILFRKAGHLDAMHHAVMWHVRLPRVLLAILTGAALAGAGVLMQALFRNPLADPALIGVSAGAALGAVGMIVLGATLLGGAASWLGQWTLPLAAFVGAVLASILIFGLARREGVVNATTMLLCGIAINALVSAMIGLMTYMATDDQLRNLTFWSLGSLTGAVWPAVFVMMTVMVVLVAAGMFLSSLLNALLLGESQAFHLGVPVELLKRAIVGLTAAAAGSAVAFTGMIGFIGLVAPHLARLLVGPDHRYVFPLSGILGAILLVSGDLLARIMIRPSELPLGILTALLGAPFFLWLLRNNKSL